MQAIPALTPTYALHLPKARLSAVLFASPHSGAEYPEELLRRTVLEPRLLRSSEDAFVAQLLAAAPAQGAAVIAARLPRAWVDLNRGPDELDPRLIEGLRGGATNPRIAAGLGVIPRVVAAGRAIYAGKISREEARLRIDTCWQPYHARLAALLDMVQARNGRAILVDMHSMPHESLEAFGAARPQIVLGDRFGAAAAPEITAAVEAAFVAEGLRVARNAPFAGAYVAQTYGRPSRGRHVVQVEIDRALYMDERGVRRSADFDRFAALMARVTGRLAAFGAGGAALPMAAE
jgi:N-formylglutamate amidohydrolase